MTLKTSHIHSLTPLVFGTCSGFRPFSLNFVVVTILPGSFCLPTDSAVGVAACMDAVAHAPYFHYEKENQAQELRHSFAAQSIPVRCCSRHIWQTGIFTLKVRGATPPGKQRAGGAAIVYNTQVRRRESLMELLQLLLSCGIIQRNTRSAESLTCSPLSCHLLL